LQRCLLSDESAGATAKIPFAIRHSGIGRVTLSSMPHTDSICFGLLAGGQSRRMGVDKASLLWCGKPLWQHQLRLTIEIGATEILISGKAGGPYCAAGVIVTDEVKDLGPIAGLAALLAQMKSEWLVVAGVDMPFLDAATLQEVLKLRKKNRGVVPIVDNRAQALAAVYPRAAITLAKQSCAAEDHSLQSFVRAAEAAGLVRLVPWNSAEVFRSLNTPDEWSAASGTVPHHGKIIR
jgi:molybdopterin-guanine dinucleotide biosynthesis protein A